MAGTTNTDLPIPTDGCRSEAEEYVALALSLTNDRDSYQVVEAEPQRASWARQHSVDNGVDSLVTVIEATCWRTETTLSFPVLDAIDMGGAVLAGEATSDGSPSMDYWGAFLEHRDEPTGLLHIDLQGIELEVTLPALELIEQNVRFLAVGTHNRYIEGMLQQTLLRREWALLLESPSTAIFDGVRPSLSGFTVQDGNQLWANSRFRDAHPMLIRQR